MPNLEMNHCDKSKLTLFCAIAKFLFPKNTYQIEEIYLDYGAGMKWETVVCVRPRGTDYQMLSPADWDKIHETDDAFDLTNLIIRIVNRQENLLA